MEVEGLESTGKSFRFVRACERARRGEAVWASERRFDPVARAVVSAVQVLLLGGETVPGGLSTKNVDVTVVVYGFSRTTFIKPMQNNIVRGQPCKTNVKTICFADNLGKRLLFQ